MLNIFKKKPEKRADGDNYWENWQALRSNNVNPDTAQSISAVYASVGALAEAIASLPLHLYKKDEQREKAINHPLYSVLHDAANEYQTAVEFREWMTACYLLRGNAYAYPIRGYDGQVTALIPLPPETVSVYKYGNEYIYQTVINDKPVKLRRGEIFHLRHRGGKHPILGASPIAVAHQAISLALAEQQHGEAMFNNGTQLTGVIQTQPTTTSDQATQIATSWKATHAGAQQHGGTPVLPFGAEFKSVSMTLEDAEWLASRKFSVEEIARIFHVPPTIIGDLEYGNYSNSVELARQFVTFSLRRHLVMWEQSISQQLLTPLGRTHYFAEHNVEGLLRGDSLNRAQFYQSGIDAGWLLPSEARRLENLPPVEGIDEKAHTVQTQEQSNQTQHGSMAEDKANGAS